MPKPPSGITFPSDASYLFAGGLGGLGRSISHWMVSNGARNLIYASRSGTSSPEAMKFVNGLTAAGVRVQVLSCDIADEPKLSASLSLALKTMPPIRGVIQGAMVLKDQIFSNMSFETFMNTIRPKVHGSWSLHKATLNQPLDFFVFLSSASGFLGNAGQSNYVAACTYQVALTAHRLAQGLPATAIDIGKVASVGFVAENAGTMSEQNLVRMGFLDIREEELHTMVELAMMPRSQGVANGYMITGAHTTVDAGSTDQELPFWSRNPVFSHLENLRPHLARSARSNAAEGSSQESLSSLLGAATSLSGAISSVLDALLRKLSRSLMMALEDIDAGRSSSAYGIDSLIAVDIRNWIFREAKADVPVFEILQAVTLTALAQTVAEKSALLSQNGEVKD
jgi:short-subunit dehydrogenase